MRFARIISKLYAEPLLLEPNAWRSFDHALRNIVGAPALGYAKRNREGKVAGRVDIDPDPEAGDDSPATRQDAILEIRTPAQMSAPSTAIIRVEGVIDKHVSLMDLECYGGCDLDDVDAALEQVGSDDSIQNVLLFFNTPGGSIIGVPETADRIYALAQKKNVKSFCDSICCSGGIFLASQASEFFVTKSAYTGSIGVISGPFLDFSKQLEHQGITPTIIKSGKFKDTGTELRPMTDDEKTMLQERSDRIMGMFTGAVKRGRPSISAASMQGQVFFGSEAVQVGLADAIVSDLAEALAQF